MRAGMGGHQVADGAADRRIRRNVRRAAGTKPGACRAHAILLVFYNLTFLSLPTRFWMLLHLVWLWWLLAKLDFCAFFRQPLLQRPPPGCTERRCGAE
eukprot:351138-Chlamydomonas_euryale.AAC.13